MLKLLEECLKDPHQCILARLRRFPQPLATSEDFHFQCLLVGEDNLFIEIYRLHCYLHHSNETLQIHPPLFRWRCVVFRTHQPLGHLDSERRLGLRNPLNVVLLENMLSIQRYNVVQTLHIMLETLGYCNYRDTRGCRVHEAELQHFRSSHFYRFHLPVTRNLRIVHVHMEHSICVKVNGRH